MTRDEFLDRLFQQPKNENPNLEILHRLILVVYYAWFRVNGQSPASDVPLKDYVFDAKRIIIDLNELSEEKRKKFDHWFWEQNIPTAEHAFLSSAGSMNYRGYTVELLLSFWGRVINWIFYQKKSYLWSLSPLELTTDYQLNSLEICNGSRGLLIGLNQFGLPPENGQYQPVEEQETKPLINTKRVMITDKIVDYLAGLDLSGIDFRELIEKKHPFSIDVQSMKHRYKAMNEFRKVHHFDLAPPWYMRFYRWTLNTLGTIAANIKSFLLPSETSSAPISEPPWYNRFFKAMLHLFSDVLNKIESLTQKIFLHQDPVLPPPPANKSVEKVLKPNKFKLFSTYEKLQLFRHIENGKILVMEEKKAPTLMALSGGGAKLFSQLGSVKAALDHNIQPVKFSGSSAGAIVALLCYIGYSVEEINIFFSQLKKENVIYFNIDREGIYDTQALKAALDYMLTRKVTEIIDKYNLIRSENGRKLLQEIYKEGFLSFNSLRLLHEAHPDCGIKEELTVTITNKEQSKTFYISYKSEWGHLEVTKTVRGSTAYPGAIKSIRFPELMQQPGEYNESYCTDGGLLCNLPTEVYPDTGETFLKSVHNTDLGLLALQYDNGPEKEVLSHLIANFYNNTFGKLFWNWVYGFLTGVKNPVTAWRNELEKIRSLSMLIVLIHTGKITATDFKLTHKDREDLYQNGYEAMKTYLNPRMNGKEYVEGIYDIFSSLEELAFYCCYRGFEGQFDWVCSLLDSTGKKLSLPENVREIYFSSSKDKANKKTPPKSDNTIKKVDIDKLYDNNRLFINIHPIFLKIPNHWVDKKDEDFLLEGKHSLCLESPLLPLRFFNCFMGKRHILFAVFIEILANKQLTPEIEPLPTEAWCKLLEQFYHILDNDTVNPRNKICNAEEFYHKWQLSFPQIKIVLDLAAKKDWQRLRAIMAAFKANVNPLLDSCTEGEEELIFLDDIPENSPRF